MCLWGQVSMDLLPRLLHLFLPLFLLLLLGLLFLLGLLLPILLGLDLDLDHGPGHLSPLFHAGYSTTTQPGRRSRRS